MSTENEKDPAAKAKETIVIAEDSPPNRKILAHLLTKLGFNVIECENGKLAWEALQAEPAGSVVCVLSDIMMPEMNGIQFLSNVRQSETFQSLPFVLVTAVSERDYIMQAKAMNVNGYILKPVTFQSVTEKLQQFFPDRTFPKLKAA